MIAPGQQRDRRPKGKHLLQVRLPVDDTRSKHRTDQRIFAVGIDQYDSKHLLRMAFRKQADNHTS